MVSQKGRFFSRSSADDNAVTTLRFEDNETLFVEASQGRQGLWGLDGLPPGETAGEIADEEEGRDRLHRHHERRCKWTVLVDLAAAAARNTGPRMAILEQAAISNSCRRSAPANLTDSDRSTAGPPIQQPTEKFLAEHKPLFQPIASSMNSRVVGDPMTWLIAPLPLAPTYPPAAVILRPHRFKNQPI